MGGKQLTFAPRKKQLSAQNPLTPSASKMVLQAYTGPQVVEGRKMAPEARRNKHQP